MNKTPNFINRPTFRLNGALEVGAVVAGSATVSDVVDVGGAAAIAVRIKTSGAGTLACKWVGPDCQWNTDSKGRDVATPVTVYSTGNPTNVSVTGGTEAVIFPTHSGEGVLQVIFTDTSTSNNTISYCDVSQRSGAGV